MSIQIRASAVVIAFLFSAFAYADVQTDAVVKRNQLQTEFVESRPILNAIVSQIMQNVAAKVPTSSDPATQEKLSSLAAVVGRGLRDSLLQSADKVGKNANQQLMAAASSSPPTLANFKVPDASTLAKMAVDSNARGYQDTFRKLEDRTQRAVEGGILTVDQAKAILSAYVSAVSEVSTVFSQSQLPIIDNARVTNDFPPSQLEMEVPASLIEQRAVTTTQDPAAATANQHAIAVANCQMGCNVSATGSPFSCYQQCNQAP